LALVVAHLLLALIPYLAPSLQLVEVAVAVMTERPEMLTEEMAVLAVEAVFLLRQNLSEMEVLETPPALRRLKEIMVVGEHTVPA
jgi:hypothetical protein